MYQDTDLQLPSSSAYPLPNQSFLATQRLLCEKAISSTDNLIPAVENKLSQFSKDITETKYFDKSLGEEIFYYRLALLKEHIISELEESILQHAAESQMMADTALATLGTLKEKMAAGLPKNKLSLEDQLIELQGIVGKYRLSPRCYEQGLDSLKETLSDNIHHIEIIEKIRKLFQTSLKNQPEFLMECFQNDVFSEFNESSKNNEYFEQVVNYYKPLIKDKVFFKQDNWLKNRYNERILSQPTAVKKHQATLSLPENLLNTESEKNCYPVTITSQLPWNEPGKWLPSGSQPDPEQWIKNVVVRVNSMLALRLPAPIGEAHRLCEAMHYATLGGGKRIRTLLCHAAGMTCGASEVVLDEVSAAIEMVHTASLVHDDLPALDDDVLRRGRPTTHLTSSPPY